MPRVTWIWIAALLGCCCALEAGSFAPRSGASARREKKMDAVEQKKLSKLEISAQQMQTEGEGRRSRSDISGKVEEKEVVCPICDLKMPVWIVERQLAEKGVDRDFCKHSKARSAYDFDVWCCPRCGYAAFGQLFQRTAESALKEKVVRESTPALRQLFKRQLNVDIEKFGFQLDQMDIPTIIKYHMMEHVLEDLGASDYEKARFYLQFAWAERQRLLAPVSHPALSVAVSTFNTRWEAYKKSTDSPDLIRDPAEVAAFLDGVEGGGKLNDEERLLLAIYRAGQTDRLGFPARSRQLLEDAGRLTMPAEVLAVARFKREVLEHEFELMKKALVLLKEALRRREIPVDRRPEHIYLVGELSRRIGLFPEARVWFDLVARVLPEGSALKTWSGEQGKLLSPQEKAETSPALDAEMSFAGKIQRELAEDQRAASDQHKALDKEMENTEEWLRTLSRAVEVYHMEYDAYPADLNELVSLGILHEHQRLETVAAERFVLAVNSHARGEENAFRITCRLPQRDGEGLYWVTVNSQHALERLRTPPPEARP